MERFIDMSTRLAVLILIFLLAFISAWLYTEVKEELDRDKKWDYIEHFIDEGGRFTQEDGVELERRIRVLEEEVDILNGD